jgi:glutathione S-transferase
MAMAAARCRVRRLWAAQRRDPAKGLAFFIRAGLSFRVMLFSEQHVQGDFMKMYYSPASPFARKCLVVAHELGLINRIEIVDALAHPINTNTDIARTNPLGQIPTLLLDDGTSLHDSRVICEYLNTRGKGELIPSDDGKRWLALTEHSIADGALDAALLARYEKTARPEALQWSDWLGGQMNKINRSLAYFESVIEKRAKDVDIGTITLACLLGYLDLRFSDFNWRAQYPALDRWLADFGKRPSMQETVPRG